MPIEDNSTTRINIAHTSPFADEVHSEIDVVNNSNHLQTSDFEGILSAWTQYQQVSMSIPFLSNILFMANDGSSSEQAAVFQAILDKEPIVMAHLQTRKTSIMGVDWDIMGDNSYKCSEIKRIMEDAGYHDLTPHLLDCIGNGYAGAGITWEAGWRSIQTFIKVNHTNWIFDKYGNIALIRRDGSQVPITKENAHTVVFHQYQMRSGIPSQGGVLRPLVWTYFFKHVITKEQVRYLEKYGMPMLIGKLSEADFNNESVRPKIKAMLRNLAAQGCGVINQTTDIQSIKVDSAVGGNADYLRFIQHCNDIYAITILGQKASSGDAGGLSKGQMQENVRKDILKSDCMSLMSTVNNQIVKRLEYNRWGTNECTFKMDIEEAEDLEALAKNVIAFAGIGLKAKRSWLEDKFNIPFEEEAPVQPMAGLGALSGAIPTLPPVGSGSPTASTPEPTEIPNPSGSTTSAPLAEPTVPDMSNVIPPTTTPMNDFKKKAHLISLADIDSEYHSIIDDSIKDSELPDEIKSEVINPDIRDSVQYEQHINDKLTNIALQQPEYADAINNIRQNVGNVDMNTIIEKAQARKQTATQAPQFLQEDEEQEAELTPEESELKLRLDKTTIPTEEEKAQEEKLRKAEEKNIYKEPKKQLTVEQIAKKYGVNIDASTAITRGNARTNFNLAISWALITSGKELPPEQIEEFRKLNEALEKQDIKATEDSSWIGKQISSFAESIPSLINGLIQGGAGALITAVPTLGLGSLPGFGIGMGQYMARESAGQMYANMVFNENVQPDIARAASIIGAIPMGALNFLQFKKLSNFVPGGKQTVDALINKQIENVSKIVATDLMAEFAKHQVQGTAIQATQLATERVITEGAKAVEASIDGSEYSVDVKDQLKNIAFGTMASIIPNMLMSGVFLPLNVKEYKGTVIDAKARGDAQRRAKRIAEELESKMVPEKEIKPVADLVQEPKNEKPIDLETDANQVFLTKKQIDSQLANYLKDNPRAKDTTIEFVSKDNPALENQNGVFDKKENKIYINQDNITSDKNLTGLLAHEDFSHKFLESTISRNERTNLINAIDKLIKSGDNTFWDVEKETKYKELYSKNIDAFNKVDNEKIANFIAERGYEALDKNSKEFAPIRKLVEWFKAHFAHIFGKASEDEVLHYLSNTFKKYRDEKFKPVESQDKTSSFAVDKDANKAEPYAQKSTEQIINDARDLLQKELGESSSQAFKEHRKILRKIAELNPVKAEKILGLDYKTLENKKDYLEARREFLNDQLNRTDSQDFISQDTLKRQLADVNASIKHNVPLSTTTLSLKQWYNTINKERKDAGKVAISKISELVNSANDLITDFVNNNPEFIDKKETIKNLKASMLDKFDTKGNIDSKTLDTLDSILNKALDKERTKQTDVASKIVATLTPDEFKELTNLSDKGYESLTPEQRQAWWDTNETLESLNQKISEQLTERAKVSELLLQAKQGGGTYANLQAAVDTHDRLINIYKKQKQSLGGMPTIEDIISTVDSMKQTELKANVRTIINDSKLTSISDFKIGSIKADLKNLINDYDKSDISNRGKILLKISDIIDKAREQDEAVQHDKLVRRVQDAQDKIRASIDNKKVILPEAIDNFNKWLGKFNEFTPEEMTEYINIAEKPNYDYTVDELSLITRYYYQGKKLEDLTSAQLKEHLEDLKSIQKDNKSLIQAQYDAKKAELDKTINQIVDTINSSSKTKGVVTTFEQLPTESGVQPKSVVDKVKTWVKVLWRQPEHIILSMCNNDPESFLYRTLFLNGFNSRTTQLVNDNESYNFMKGNYKDFLISTKTKIKNNDFTFDIDMVQAENTAEKGKPANNIDAYGRPTFVKGATKQYEGTPTVSLSLKEMCSIYGHNQNIVNYIHLLNTFVDVWYTDKNGKKQLLLDENGKQRRVKITPELVRLVVDKMTTPDDKGGFESYANMVDRQIDYYTKVQYDKMNKTFKAIHGYDMEKVDRYIPISFLKDFDGATDEGLIYMNMKRKVMRDVAKGVTIDRIEGARQGFNNLDWGDVIVKNALQANYYMSWAEHINNVNKIMSDPKVKEVMDTKFPGAYDSLLEHYKTQATGRIEKVAGDDLISLARNIFSVATLGLKIPTILVQAPFGLISRYATPLDANLKSTYAILKELSTTGSLKDTMDFVNTSSGMMRTRLGSDILQKYSPISENTQTGFMSLFNGKSWSEGELLKAGKEIMNFNLAKAAGHTVKAISGGTQLIMYPIAAVEQFMAVLAWKAHYDYLSNDKNLSAKYDHNKRVEICDNIIRGTTPIFDVRFQSQLMNSPAFRALTLFKGPQAQLTSNIVNKLIGAVKNDSAGGEAFGGSAREQFVKIAVASAVATMLTQVIRSGFTSTPWEEKEDFVKAYYDNMFGGEFFTGTAVQALLQTVSNIAKENKGEEPEPYWSRSNNVLSSYLDATTGIINNPSDSKKWFNLIKAVAPVSTFGYACENHAMMNMLFDTGSATDKMKGIEVNFYSGFAMNLKRDYPLSYVMGKGYQKVDERIKEYNKKNPDKAWHPSKISDVLKLKDGVEVQLGSYDYYTKSEYTDYLNLINEYIEHSGGLNELFGYSSLEEYDIKKLKSILARAKEYAKTTLTNDPVFAYRHRAEIAKASNLIE